MNVKGKIKRKKDVKEDYDNFTTCDVIKAVPKQEVPDGETIIGGNRARKKKHAGTYRDRLNDRRHEKIDGTHNNSKYTSSSIVNEETFGVLLAIMLTFRMLGGVSHLKTKFLYD